MAQPESAIRDGDPRQSGNSGGRIFALIDCTENDFVSVDLASGEVTSRTKSTAKISLDKMEWCVAHRRGEARE